MPRLLPTLLASAALIAGCAEPSLDGKWVEDGPAKRTIELSKDGKATMSLDMLPGAALSGNYKVSGNRIAITDLKPDGMPDAPFGADSMLPKKIEATFSWKNDREVVFAGDRFLQGGFKRAE
ncbi:MAG: hypothetical protein JSS65_09030 [Armatimonadetes bacterium]|nr:hypothetical protein [Armatimonadota bacterium]